MNDFKEQVRDAIDLREVMERYGVTLKRVNATTAKCCCPIHNEKTPSCHVHADYYYCYGCHATGDVFSFLMERERVEFFDALRMAAELVNIPVPARSQDPERAAAYEQQRRRELTMRELLTYCQDFYRDCLENMPVGQAAREYCNSRGWTKPIRERWGIGFAPDDVQLLDYIKSRSASAAPDLENQLLAAGMMGTSETGFRYMRFKQRVMFPVHDVRGRLCGFSGRWLRPDDWPADKKEHAKYLNTPATELFIKGDLLYGQHHAAKMQSRTCSALVVEGQPDVIGCHLAGFETAVAPMGTALTLPGIQQLMRFTDNGKITLVFDGDDAGIKATSKTIDLILEHAAQAGNMCDVRLHCATLPEGNDPDDLARSNPAALQAVIDNAPAWYVWLAKYMLGDNEGHPQGVPVQLVHKYLQKVQGIESEVETDLAIKAVVDLTGLKLSTIKRQLKAIRTGRTSDGRSLTSAENGQTGGRPRNDYAGFADEYISHRQKDGVFTRRFYRGAWRRYTKGRWVELTDDDMGADIIGWVRKNYRELSESRTVSNILLNLDSADTGHIMSSIEAPVWLTPSPAQQALGVTAPELNEATGEGITPAPGWVPMTNGALHIPSAIAGFDGDEFILDERAFIKPTARLFSLHYLDYAFEPEAGCPKFLQYLNDVQPDVDGRHMIRCMMGLMLVPDTRFNVFFLLQGLAGTGKSVFLHILDNLVGRHNVCTVPLVKLDDDHYTWQLTENLMNSIDDMREVSLRDVEGTIKVATDGGYLDIRRLYKDGGRAKVIARTVAACNLLPRVHEKSAAIWDRMRVIPFDVVVRGTGKQNRNLKHEIVRDELPGIFMWALGGLAALQGLHVFPEHPGGLTRKDEHRGECDPTAVFLREYYHMHPDCKIHSSEIYGHYKAWAAENGYRQQAAGSFNRDIERVFNIDRKPVRIGDKVGKGFIGLRRNPETYAQPVADELIPID